MIVVRRPQDAEAWLADAVHALPRAAAVRWPMWVRARTHRRRARCGDGDRVPAAGVVPRLRHQRADHRYRGMLGQHTAGELGFLGETQFNAALASRDVIGQAKGVLMHRENLTGMQAFALLLKTSQNANIKLIEIARWVVEQFRGPEDTLLSGPSGVYRVSVGLIRWA